MKRMVKLIGEDEDHKVEITVRLTRGYSGSIYTSLPDKTDTDISSLVDRVVKDVLMPDFHFSNIKAHKR